MEKIKSAPTALDAVPEIVQKKSGEIAESGETYLETILVMKERRSNGLVRAVDVANELKLSKPSVSRGLGLLKEKNLIQIGIAGDIEFTPEGRKLAERVFKRHQYLTVFFKHIAKVPSDVAEADACRVEHVISDKTMKGIIAFLKENEIV
ncbi:MAG: metal-dependent transcriptional regulator [Succinatimonas sp.]|jgi:DtxR family Mn-dependent transcriptional regulator|nr:metal-dependent transcriptional regulator [Succinatimonas sp.]MDD5869585.1 metal-dependent transcriptional regulator [Succinatimonas sp.]MDY5721097.1 metal-dependent transcriptional regulator [Succinivibrio sp.]